MKKKTGMYLAIGIIGIALALIAKFLLQDYLSDSQSGAMIGIGAGLFGYGIAKWCVGLWGAKNPDLMKINEIEEKDERNQLIRSKAQAISGEILHWLLMAGVYLLPEEKTVINEIVMTWLPYFVFIMYAINRGTNFTQALFMNCDHSLLTYSFYKQPSFILRLFQIRLREIMKINAVPALVIGIGLALILFATGGTDNPLNYVVLVVSILCMSLFFSIHYLTIYYLLQPYNAGTELKSGTYRIVLSVTYVICFALMRLRMPIMIFGIMTIVFCVLYSIVASILVYRLAPKTFRLRT